jgi:hypothetical protein
MRRGYSACLTLSVLLGAGCSSPSGLREVVGNTDAAHVSPVDTATRAMAPSIWVSVVQGQAAGEDGYVPGETVGDQLRSYSTSFPLAPAYGKGGWILLPIEGAIYILGLPFAAASTGPSPEDAEEARSALRPVLADSGWPGKIEDAFVTVIRSSDDGPGIVSDASAAAAQLTLALDGPILSVRGGQGQPVLLVRGMLELGGACLVDRRWQWNGVPVDYFELADKQEDLRRQIEGGARQIALAVAEDLFLSDKPRQVEYNRGAAPHQAKPKMSLWPALYPNRVAGWDENLGEDAKAPCGRTVAPADAPESAKDQSRRP